MATLNRLTRQPDEEREAAGTTAASGAPAPPLTRILALQRSAGNAAVRRGS